MSESNTNNGFVLPTADEQAQTEKNLNEDGSKTSRPNTKAKHSKMGLLIALTISLIKFKILSTTLPYNFNS